MDQSTVDQSIARLALHFSSPSYWHPGHSANLRDFLSHLLEPSLPGFAAISGAPGEDGNLPPQWLVGSPAVERVAACHEHSWLPTEQRIDYTSGSDDADELLDRFLEAKAVLFLDDARFAACCQRLSDADRVSDPNADHVGPYWIGLTLDWAEQEGAIAWFPQFRVYSYWPESPYVAPPEEDQPAVDDGHAHTLTAETAADLLDRSYWRTVETNFRSLRIDFGLGTADTGDFEPPVFYVAIPTAPPSTPDEYITDGWWATIAALSAPNLKTADPFADAVSVAAIDGRFVAFSNAYRSARTNQRQDYYLLLSVAGGTTGAVVDEISLSRATDQLAFSHFSAARTASIIMNEASVLRQQMSVQARLLARTGETTQRILDAVSVGPHVKLGPGSNGLSRLSRELQLVVERMKLQFTRSELGIEGLESKLARGKDVDAAELPRRLAIRRVAGARQLSGAELAPNVVATADLSELRVEGEREIRNLGQLKATFDGVLAHLAQGERERQSQQERTLSFLLVFLAAIVAFPLITGHMDWKELGSVINRRSALGKIVWETHVAVAWISLTAAVLGILALIAYLAQRSARLREGVARFATRARGPGESRDAIAAIWIDATDGLLRKGGENAAALTRDPDDQRVARALAAECQRLLSAATVDGRGGRVAALRAEVATVGAVVELFVQRPPLALPITLTFLRLCGPPFFGAWVGGEVVSDRELMIALLASGMDLSQMRAALTRVQEHAKDAPAETIEDAVALAERLLFEDGPAGAASPSAPPPDGDAGTPAPSGGAD